MSAAPTPRKLTTQQANKAMRTNQLPTVHEGKRPKLAPGRVLNTPVKRGGKGGGRPRSAQPAGEVRGVGWKAGDKPLTMVRVEFRGVYHETDNFGRHYFAITEQQFNEAESYAERLGYTGDKFPIFYSDALDVYYLRCKLNKDTCDLTPDDLIQGSTYTIKGVLRTAWLPPIGGPRDSPATNFVVFMRVTTIAHDVSAPTVEVKLRNFTQGTTDEEDEEEQEQEVSAAATEELASPSNGGEDGHVTETDDVSAGEEVDGTQPQDPVDDAYVDPAPSGKKRAAPAAPVKTKAGRANHAEDDGKKGKKGKKAAKRKLEFVDDEADEDD